MSTLSNYDDVSMFTPEGKVKPLEHIRNTVELGNTTIALANSNLGIIIGHTGPVSPLAYQAQKIFKISETSAFAFSGMTNDGLEIVEHLIDETIWHETYKDQPIHHLQIFDYLSSDASYRTMTSNKRLYGVSGVFMMRNDGVKLVEFDPTGMVHMIKGTSIGNRSQSARTVLENYVESFEEMDKRQLVRAGIEALRNAHPEDSLSPENVNIWSLEEKIEVLDVKEFM